VTTVSIIRTAFEVCDEQAHAFWRVAGRMKDLDVRVAEFDQLTVQTVAGAGALRKLSPNRSMIGMDDFYRPTKHPRHDGSRNEANRSGTSDMVMRPDERLELGAYFLRASICPSTNRFTGSFVKPSAVASSTARFRSQPSTRTRLMSHIPAALLPPAQ
jgi:hypothetical protein